MRLFVSLLVLAVALADLQAAPPADSVKAFYAGSATRRSTEPEVNDGLEEVNQARARRGLRPFVRDEGLFAAAKACAQTRAQHLIAGHLSSDFAYLPPGVSATSAGCGALEPSWGWGTCCTYDNYTYAGAAWVMGRDGKRYMHLFVR